MRLLIAEDSELKMTTTEPSFEASSDTLCEVIAVFRHGHRAPIIFSPSDPNKNFWPNGAGALTNIGREDGYLIGTFLRKRYPKFLSEKYESDDIYVRSTDVDRNLLTAQCCLAGLYPPKGDDVWKADLAWQPIPVHTVEFSTDVLVPKFSKNFTPHPGGYKTDEENAAYKIISDNQHVIDAFSSDYNSDVQNIGIALLLLDAFVMEVDEGLPMYSPPGIQVSEQEVRILLENVYLLTCKTGKCIISAVYLLEDILKQASRKIAGEVPKQKAFFYCMHDLTISACLEAFNYSSRAQFGGILLFELHKRPGTNDYFIKMFFKPSIRDAADPEVISINGSPIAPIAAFEKIVKKFAADNHTMMS